jgi:hypothetical protein
LAKFTGGGTPKTVDSNEKTSVKMEKSINASPPTTCRPGVVRAVDPANGSVSKRKISAAAVALKPRRTATVRYKVERRIFPPKVFVIVQKPG